MGEASRYWRIGQIDVIVMDHMATTVIAAATAAAASSYYCHGLCVPVT